MTPDDILRRQATFELTRTNFENLWQRVAEYVLPQQDDFRRKYSQGATRTNHQYDAFPQVALNNYAAAMEAGLTPRTNRWHHLATGYPEIDDNHEVKLYAENLSELLWRMRYSPRANFASQNHQVLMFNGAFGNGVMFIEPHPKGFGSIYTSPHLNEMFWSQNEHGFIDTFHRKRMISIRSLIARFGTSRLPDKIMKQVKAGKIDEEYELLHCVMPRKDVDPMRLDAKGMPYTDMYILIDGKVPLQDVDEAGYRELPYMVFRHTVSSREDYGRGPGTMMLPNIKMINMMARDVIEAANMAVDPPTLLHADNILSEFRLTPGARNYGGVDDNGKQMAIPYQNGADVGITLEMIQDVRAQIDDVFLGGYFRVLMENPNMKATTAMLLSQQQGQKTSPVVGRGHSEYLNPMLRRESGITFRQGLHPEMPDVLVEFLRATRQPMTMQYDSPMTRASRIAEAVGLQQSFEALAPWAQIKGETVYRRFDEDQVAKIMAEVNGVPAKALKSDEQLEAEDAQQAEMAATQMALEAAPVAANTVKTLADAQVASASVPQQIAGA